MTVVVTVLGKRLEIETRVNGRNADHQLLPVCIDEGRQEQRDGGGRTDPVSIR